MGAVKNWSIEHPGEPLPEAPPTSAAECEACAEPILEDSVAPTIGMLSHVEALHRELAEAREALRIVIALFDQVTAKDRARLKKALEARRALEGK